MSKKTSISIRRSGKNEPLYSKKEIIFSSLNSETAVIYRLKISGKFEVSGKSEICEEI